MDAPVSVLLCTVLTSLASPAITTPPSDPGRLQTPVMDLNLTNPRLLISYADYVAALPDGQAIVAYSRLADRSLQVKKLDNQGNIIQHMYSCRHVGCYPTGLLVLGDCCYVIHRTGEVAEIHLNGTLLNTYRIPGVTFAIQAGPMAYDPKLVPDKDLLLLADYYGGEVFSYRLSTRKKTVFLKRLGSAKSVSYGFINNQTVYIVTDTFRGVIRVYNTNWRQIKRLGKVRFMKRHEYFPLGAVMMPDNNLIFTDRINIQVGVFDYNSGIIRPMLTESDGLKYVTSFSIQRPYLWVTRPLARFKLYSN